MFEQIQNHDPPARPGDPEGFLQGTLGSHGMMQGLTEKDQINRTILNRRFLHFPQPVLQIRKPISPGHLRAILYHLFRGIDRDDMLRPLRQQLGKRALPCPEIGYHPRWHEQQKGLREGLPGAARQITAPKFPSQLIKVDPGRIRALPQHQLERLSVLGGIWNLRPPLPQ